MALMTLEMALKACVSDCCERVCFSPCVCLSPLTTICCLRRKFVWRGATIFLAVVLCGIWMASPAEPTRGLAGMASDCCDCILVRRLAGEPSTGGRPFAGERGAAY